MMIDLSDCDRIFPKDEGFKSLIELSILLGRVVKMCYTPTGVINVKDEQAQALANEIQSWLFALTADFILCQSFAGARSNLCGAIESLLCLCRCPGYKFLVRPLVSYWANTSL